MPTPRKGPRWTEYMDLDALQPDPRNPKAHDLDELNRAFERFGYVESVTIDERTGLLAAGHGRREQLLERKAAGLEPPDGVTVDAKGRWQVPVGRGWSSADDAEALAYLVTSNRIPELGGWRQQALAETLDQLRDGPGLDGIGFSSGDVDDLLAELGPPPEGPVGGGGDEGSRTDVRNPIICPACGHSFHRV